MIRVFEHTLEREIGGGGVKCFRFLQILSILSSYLRVFISISLLKSEFIFDLILQFGIRDWYSNLRFNNLQIHLKNSDFF
ncbi:hypothetical protein HanRHA438_Chr12g0547951 [Helianthus annuus]|nr:hypothetical protein HanRHA438_Chr12g0547951 [Helianthus annuus]